MPRERKKEPPKGEVILQKTMEAVMHESMLPYSEFVILERALPRVEDGLKPVQRRILYTMLELGNTPDKPHKKCARITGDCLGKYHPHGDTSVYDALARMAQDFVMRGLLVDGHGNFGSIDGDSPAAMRYTEARLTELALEMLNDIDKDTVPFRLNFDDTRKEPDMLPGAFPNLLVNGASGIAVGLATNIPPHNLGESIDAVLAQIKNPKITTKELMQYLPAPDFPTGGQLIMDSEELYSAYETGRGKLQMRAKTHIEPGPSGRSLIVITEIPYQVNKSAMLEKILHLSEEKKALFSGIYDIRDESDRSGMRAVIEVRKEADVQKLLAALYKYSDMQMTFGVNMVAIANGKPMQMGLKAIIGAYIGHRRNVVTRRTRFDLNQAQARAHILEGLIRAVDNLDAIIKLIRASKNPKEARIGLMEKFDFTELQAQAILDMRLQRLTGLEILTLREEYAELQKKIAYLEEILHSDKKLMQVIGDELKVVRKKYADARRTELIPMPGAKELELPEQEQPVAEETSVYMTQNGFLKRMSGKLIEKALEEEELPPKALFATMTDHKLLFFTDKGNCFALPVPQIPECRSKDRGIAPAGVLAGLEKDETVVDIIDPTPGDFTGTLLFVTQRGQIKASNFAEYDVRTKKFAALKVRDGDKLIQVLRPCEEEDLLMVSRAGFVIRFHRAEVPLTGRTTAGVRGMTLADSDVVLRAIPCDDEGELLLATEAGYFKRCLMVEFEPQGRGTKGVRCLSTLRKNAGGTMIVYAAGVKEPYHFIAQQALTGKTELDTEAAPITCRTDKGFALLMAVAGDTLEQCIRLP